jgi:hypothetical protein
MKGRRSKQRWSNLSAGQQATVAGAAIIQVSLLVAALRDLRRRPSAEINGNKAMWTATSFVNLVGPLAYFTFGRKR